MTAQKLKSAILQLAMQGKLVPQDPSDESVSELMTRIEAENTAQIKAGRIKKFKTLTDIVAEDLPFDIPETWRWVKLGNICQLLDGEKKNGDKYPYLEAKFLRGKTTPMIINEGKFVSKGTRLILVDGENSGEVFAATEDGYMGSTFKVLFFPQELFAQYVLYFLQFKQMAFRNNKTGSAIPHLNKDLFFNMPFPVPPLAEQKRIVAKIEELMPLVEEYGKAEERLTALNADFPDKLRKSILQQAIQGKLTERDPSDEPASELLKRIRAEKERLVKEGKIKKEKPLPPITEEEMPFEIPENWVWTRLGEYLDVRDGTHDSPKYVQHGFPLVTSKNLKNGDIEMNDIKYISKEDFDAINERSQVDEGDILFAMIGSIGNPSIVGANHEYAIKNVALFKRVLPVNETYVYFFLLEEQDSMKKKASGGVQPFVSLGYLRNHVIPLPPLAEQQRIVDRVNELLAMCDELKK